VADQVSSELIQPAAKKAARDPLKLNPPAVRRSPGGHCGVVAVADCRPGSGVEAETSVISGAGLLAQ
jgi:hypothetical protein